MKKEEKEVELKQVKLKEISPMALAAGRQPEELVSEEVKKLLQVARRYARLLELQSLSFGFRLLLTFIRMYKGVISLKLRYLLEKNYREYKNDIVFRNAMDGLFLQIYEEVKDSLSEEQFLDFAYSMGFSREVKELLREHAGEAVSSYRLKEACRANEERLKIAARKFQEKINALPTMQKV